METTIPFQGFYNSIHTGLLENILEEYITEANQDKYDLLDWKIIHTKYAEKYTEIFADRFNFSTLKFNRLSSPKYYNFETDRIICDIKPWEVEKMYQTIKHSKFEQKIKDKFTSCSGFISFYPNTFRLWPKHLSDWDLNHIGTLLETYIETHDHYHEEYELYNCEEINEYAYDLINDQIFPLIQKEQTL